MTLCVINGKQCRCQPSEGVFCELACARLTELEQQLAMANDAAAKGDLARTNAGGMEMRIQELEKALRAKHACCCRECADEIERLLPDTKVPD